MRHLFIKKGQDDIEFAMTSSDYANRYVFDLNNYKPENAEFQVISNGKFFVFYPEVYHLEITYLKMMMEEKLKDKEDLDVNEIRHELVFDIKETLDRCLRLYHANFDEKKKDRMVGFIVIVTKTKIFRISPLFQVDEDDCFLDGGDVETLSINELLGDPSPFALMEKYVNVAIEDNQVAGYPIVYGSFKNELIEVLSSVGEVKQYQKEEFVCRY